MHKNILALFLCFTFGILSCGSKKQLKTEKPVNETRVETSEKATLKKEKQASAMPSESTPYTAKGPVALVNDVEIPAQDFNDEVGKFASMASQIPAERLELMKTQIINNLVSKMIVESAVAPILKDIKADDLETEFNHFFDQMNKNPGGVEQFYKRAGLTENDIKEDMKKGLALKALLAKDYDLKVSAKEIDVFYTENKTQFERKAEIKASHILFKAKSDNKEELAEAKKKAMEVYALAKKPGADFAALAKEKSEGPSAEKGGDLGFFTAARMVPEFSEAAFATKKGGITKPVKTAFGYHVIKVFEKKDGGLTPISEVSGMIRQRLEMVKMKEAMRIYLAGQKEIQKVEVFLENVVDNPKFEARTFVGESPTMDGIQMPIDKKPKGE